MSFFAFPLLPNTFPRLRFSHFGLALVTLLLPVAASAQTATGGAISISSGDITTHSSTATVSGATGPVATVIVELQGVVTNGTNCCVSMQAAQWMLVAPSGQKLAFLGFTGDGFDGADDSNNPNDPANGLHGLNIIVQDGKTPAPWGAPPNVFWPGTGTVTVEPSSYDSYGAGGGTPALPGGIAPSAWPQFDGCSPDPGTYNSGCSAATLNSALGGATADGTWTLEMNDFNGDPVSITGWTLTLTYSTATSTTTTISSLAANPYINTARTSPTGSTPESSITFTATVSAASGTPTGTVTFTSNGSSISGCSGLTLNGSLQASCAITLAQGYNTINAAYTATGSFANSSSSMSQLVEYTGYNLTGDTWCNYAPLTSTVPGAPLAYPDIINVSNSNYNGESVGSLTLELFGVTTTEALGQQFLLVAPGGGKHNLNFLNDSFNGVEVSNVDLTISDSSPAISPYNQTPTNGATYLPWDQNFTNPPVFPALQSPAVDSNIPGIPGTINVPQPDGGANAFTFEQAFNGAPVNGEWSLYLYGPQVSFNGGYCINFTINSGASTTTTVTSNSANQKAYTNSSVTITATVESGGNPVTSGGLTFKDATLNAVLATNVSVNSNGVATYTSSALTEGDHKITATYNPASSAYNTSFGSMYQRIDDTTTVTAVNSNTWQYCNTAIANVQTGTITIPMSTSGPETPNPSNIFVANLPGTVNTATLTLNNFSILVADELDNTESLVVGPTGAGLDFFSNTAGGTLADEALAGNYTFEDGAGGLVSNGSGNISPGTYRPTSYVGTDNANDVFTADPGGFYTLPGTFGYSASRGTSTFDSEFGSTNPNGTWSLYFNSPNANAAGTGAANGWCVNLTENLPTVSVTTENSDTFTQGQQNATFTINIDNNGTNGPTGDPTGSSPMKVTDTLNSAFTYSTFSGTGWSCSASSQVVTCTNDNPIAQGSSYPALTIDVNVSGSATGNVSNSVSASGAGVATTTSNSDSITIDVAPAITSASSTTFTAGTAGAFTVTTTGNPTPSLSEIGTLPSGVTFIDNGNGTATITGTAAIANSFPITITATNGGSSNATQTFTLTVNPGAATHLTIPGGPEPFYTAFGFNIYAYDAFGNSAISYNGTVAFTSSDPGFVNLGPVTLVNGVGSQTGVLKTAGTDSITATDTTNPSITGTGFFTIQPGVATHIGVSAPASAYVGSPISYTVTAYDLYSNVATSYAGTVHFTTTDPGAGVTLPSDYTFVGGDNGVHTFNNGATLVTVGSQTITATDAGNSLAATSSGINVTIPNYVVTQVLDDSGTATNCTIQTTPGTGTDGSCSLRDALLAAAALGSGSITFDGTAFATAQTITLGAAGTLNIPSNTSITGANLVTVNGNSDFTDFTVGSGVTGASINNLIIAGGGSDTYGGGIYNQGTLAVAGCTISGNFADNGFGAGSGGGIYNGGTLAVTNSTFSGNSAGGYGGGIFDRGTALTVTNSTFSGNSAGNGGGGGILESGTGLTVTNSTISGNSATGGAGGGILNNGGVVNLANTIVAGNSALGGKDTYGTAYTDNGGNQVSTAVNLTALGNYGGPTQTMLPLPGSTAICAGTSANATGLTTDQRGLIMPDPNCPAGSVDSGSVQTNYALSFTTDPPASVTAGSAISPAPVVGLTESGVTASAAGGSVTVTDTSTAVGGTLSASLSSGAATFTNLVFPATTSIGSDTLTATLSLNPGLSPALSITAPSSTFTVNPTPPAVSLTRTSINFGSVNFGSSSNSQSVTLTNTGGSALVISSIAVNGTNASSFVFSNNCGSSLASGANCVIHGHFAPQTSGPLTAAVTITDNAGDSPESINLSGTGVAVPVVSLTSTSLNYGSQNGGTSSASQSVTMTNNGDIALSINSISVTGTDASSFIFTNTCGTSLAPGGNCTIHGHFAPQSVGTLTAAVTISDNAPNSPQSIALSGTGVGAATAVLSVTNVNYGSVDVGLTSWSEYLTMTNTGNIPLSITSIGLTGASPSSFVFLNTCGTSLAPGANCSIHGHFAPTGPGPVTAAVTIVDNAGDSPQSISLSGTGISAATAVLSGNSLTFGPQTVGTSSEPTFVKLTNTGNQTLLITSISVTGTNASSFDFSNTCGASLASGATCLIHGHFTPTATGPLTASIAIIDNAASSPQSVALNGTGQ